MNRRFSPTLKSAVLSHFKIGGFVSISKLAILSRFPNRLFCPTLKSAILSRIRLFQSWVFWDFGFFGLEYFGTLGILGLGTLGLGILGLGILGTNNSNPLRLYPNCHRI